jgi:polysaccharide export outer membrane protein
MNNILKFAMAAFLALNLTSVTAQTNDAGGKDKNVPATDALDSQRAALPSAEFVIGTGDILAVNVWREAEISRVVPVRSDGRISLPLLGDLVASGRTPHQLEAEISAKLKDYISEPEVTVIVQEIRSQKFNVLGMVMRPGSYVLTKPVTVLDAIAIAGGFRDFARLKDMYVLRRNPDGKQSRFPFNYKEVVKGHNPGQDLELEPNDTVVIP